MGLAGQDELDGVAPGQQGSPPTGIVCEEPEALVRRVAPREPDREHVRVKRAGGRLDLRARLALGEPVDPAAFRDEGHELRALLAPGAPELGVGQDAIDGVAAPHRPPRGLGR
ncbi:MAG TPA: hypothetical protein VFY45_23485 [Baekduia sp.]|nr:hypothetical protein [Baekduia sp.]